MASSTGVVGVTDHLYRWRWWLSALLVGGYIALGASDAASALAWTFFALMLVLVWVPALVRWLWAARAARAAFREGYSDGPTH